MSSKKSWYVQIKGAYGVLFHAIAAEPDSRLKDVEGAIRIFAPRPEWKNSPARYILVEGEPIPHGLLFFCSGENCSQCKKPGWVTTAYPRFTHDHVGTIPCHLGVLAWQAAEALAGLQSDYVCLGECRQPDHWVVYDNGFGSTKFDDYDERWTTEGKNEWAKEINAQYEQRKLEFEPAPCPVCGRRPKKQQEGN